MKVVISVHGRFHGFDLARELHCRNMLAAVLTTYPVFAVRRFLPASAAVVTAPWLEIARRLHTRLHLPGMSDLWVATRFARFAACHLPEGDVFVGWSGASREVLEAARNRGMKTVVERGSTHIGHQSEILRHAFDRWGLVWSGTDPRMIEREEGEYAAADVICTSSTFARQTFIDRGIDGIKVVANPYGVDLSRFRPRDEPVAPRGRMKRLLFVGRVGVRKGVPWLLEAFGRMPPDWELHLVGPVEPEMSALLNRLPTDRVMVRGPVSGTVLPEEYRSADLFCLPSLEEGLALVLLQAMACGLPVVATAETGILDAGRAGIDVLTTPAANSDALGEVLLHAAEDADLRTRLGDNARACADRGFAWSDYGDRAVSVYRRLTGN